MKLLPLIFLAVVAFAAAKVVPTSNSNSLSIDQHGKRVYADEVEDKCDYFCAEKDPSVCASNGQCLLKFESRCAMAAYNCRNPQKMFNTVDDHRCMQDWQPLCMESDLKEFGL
ncbi:uncharacterized protein LOC128259690 [Drosophila gunungcola]|uniref:Kazal-like domain-containing protein n=1 Tax=Drosophila gunungcola TaxID=103775 RepID=A0A9P9YJD5_9MUSC|nr:uncharacterized protein LOC128259690 [Drosophila gunungcola]KAI8037891.1 hypothetical protein M5D96_009392 [Drosophila gunungcola]